MLNILVIHGPNLNLLGQRQTALYGKQTLDQLNQQLIKQAGKHQLITFQSNAEHEIVDQLQQSQANKIDGIIINPGAFAHTSIALRDALLAADLPFYEVHLTNIYARESFRHLSYLSDIAKGVVTGLGAHGYQAALARLIETLS